MAVARQVEDMNNYDMATGQTYDMATGQTYDMATGHYDNLSEEVYQ